MLFFFYHKLYKKARSFFILRFACDLGRKMSGWFMDRYKKFAGNLIADKFFSPNSFYLEPA